MVNNIKIFIFYFFRIVFDANKQIVKINNNSFVRLLENQILNEETVSFTNVKKITRKNFKIFSKGANNKSLSCI